jgi:hypothetical protein
MSAREKRSHPNLGRYVARLPARARGSASAPKAALVSADSADPCEADADALIEAFRVRANSADRPSGRLPGTGAMSQGSLRDAGAMNPASHHRPGWRSTPTS